LELATQERGFFPRDWELHNRQPALFIRYAAMGLASEFVEIDLIRAVVKEVQAEMIGVERFCFHGRDLKKAAARRRKYR